MKILIVSATHFEVKPLLNFLGIALPIIGMNNANMDFEEKEINVLITGVWHGKYRINDGSVSK